ncbi:c-type cytochrome [Thiohalocapsa sp.]|uniref:c-type cytochrome n=1 Tax=Thiohalocapsa sp. TaxID=2497641 RepID=UPI0025ED05A0|nr:c-type cytochrome [Thiohalocapsa sp.]
MKHTTFARSLVCLALVTASAASLAEEASDQSGQELFKFHGCANCHGADGKSPVSKLVPELAGKPADELYANATKILSGEGTSEESKLMHAAFYSPSNCDSPPTDEQVKLITGWLATQ